MAESDQRVEEAGRARAALELLRRVAGSAPDEVTITRADESVVLPRRAATLLAELLALVADDREVVIYPVATEHTERPRCAGCGEPLELADGDDPESWIHAFDANDRGDHSAWIEEQ